MGAGRPSKLTPETLALAGELADQGLPVDFIADAIGIHRQTCRKWVREADGHDPDDLKRQFRAVIFKAERNLARQLVGSVKNAALDGNTWAATWMLTHQPGLREQWSDAAAERRAVQRSQDRTIAVLEAAPELTSEQRRILFARLAAAGEHPDPASLA